MSKKLNGTPHGRAIVVSPIENETSSGVIMHELSTGQRKGVFVSMGDNPGIKASEGDIVHYRDSSGPYLKEENLQFIHMNEVVAVKHADGSFSCPDGTILVTADGRFNDKVKYGSLELVVPANEPNWTHAAKTKLTVAGTSSTTGCVSAGEEVFVNFGVVLNDNMHCKIDGIDYWKAYCSGLGGDVYAVDREKIEPIFGWALVEPWEEPVAVSSSLIMPEKSRQSEKIGTIKYIGENDMNPKLEVGMKVAFHEDDAFLNDFNGEKLYTMKVERITGIYE